MTSLRPYLITGHDAEGEELHGLLPKDKPFQEDWLQELLFKHPSILPVELVDEAFAPLIPIGREIASTDNLFISPKGLLTIVETKLWRNPEAHRNVVAQILDYARTLAKWDYQELDHAVQEFMKKKYAQPMTLFDVVKSHPNPLDLNEIEFRQMVQDGLTNGRFALLVVGDRILPGATQLAEIIQSAPHLRFSMRFVELQCYKLKKDSNWPLVVFPSFVAETGEVERAVVRIEYQQEKPKVEVETPSEGETSSGRKSFQAFIASLPSTVREAFRHYIEKWMKEGYTTYFGTSGFTLRIDWNGKKRTIFYVYPWCASVVREGGAREMGLPENPYNRYRESLMESPAISSAIASGRTEIPLETLSVDDVARLLSSTDALLRSLSPPPRQALTG